MPDRKLPVITPMISPTSGLVPYDRYFPENRPRAWGADTLDLFSAEGSRENTRQIRMAFWGKCLFQGVPSVVPVRVACSCGNSLVVPDQYRGKRVKCPKCSQPVAVPQDAGQKAVAGGKRIEAASSPMADLLNEVGFDKSRTDRACPNCRTEFEPDAVICVSCGYHLETGKLLKTKRIETRDPFGLNGPGTGANAPKGAKQLIAPGIILGSCILVGVVLGLIPVNNYESMGLDRNVAEIVATYAKFVVMGIGLLVAVALVLKNRPKGSKQAKQ